jgi:hypothetical protein
MVPLWARPLYCEPNGDLHAGISMADIIYLGLGALSFGLFALGVLLCERL